MIVDAHLNTSGTERPRDVLQTFDDAGVDLGVVLAPFLTGRWTLHDPLKVRAANDWLARFVRGHEDRLVGLAIVNPLHADAADEAQRALDTLGLVGLKMVPTGWMPYDACAHRVYAVASQRQAPVLFHSGIYIDGVSGRFCRPTHFEAVREHPQMRVTLAHLSWPWTDEAIAVGLIDRIKGVAPEDTQIRFDLSPGAPPAYRLDGLRKAVDVLSPALLQWGSDRILPCDGAHIRTLLDDFSRMFDALELDADARARILGGTALEWLGPRARRD